MTLFHGLSAFPITPATPDGTLVRTDFAHVLHRIMDAKVDSLCILGSTGAYAYFDPDQRRAAADTAMDQVGDAVPVIVGVGALRTDTAQALARHATAAGASGLLIAPISYTPLTDDEVFAHYATIAASTDLPICIYNNPTTTHFTFSTDLLIRLGTIPTVRAVKMPLPMTGDFAGEMAILRAAMPQGFSIGYSADWGCRPAMLAGADAFYSVAAGTWPAAMLRLVRAAQSGDGHEAGRIDMAFAPLWNLFRTFGSIRVIYRAANLLGLSDMQPPRPILPLTADADEILRDAVAAIDAL